MADFRPFRGLRYRDAEASVLSPPFDIVDADEQAALHARSPHNVIRLELGEERAGDSAEENRYTRGAATLASWRREGVLAQEERPAYYHYVQTFEHDGKRYQRTAILGRLRLEPWEANVVKPHEQTMRAPKADRIQVLRHLRANISPLFLLYRDDGRAGEAIAATGAPALDGETPDGQRHTLRVIDEPDATAAIARAFAELPLYVLDGHHRYETALAYRDEVRERAASWTGEEPENFVLIALASSADPGLVLLPFHRLVRPPTLPADLPKRLERFFHVEDTTPKSYDGTALLRLLARLRASSGTAFGALGLEEGRLHLLTLREAEAVRALMPAHSDVWKALDVSVLEYAVLRETLGIDAGPEGPVAYTEDASFVMREVESGRWPLGFLLNATTVEEMLAIADAGEKTPPKSTYFHPKLATGLVLNAHE